MMVFAFTFFQFADEDILHDVMIQALKFVPETNLSLLLNARKAVSGTGLEILQQIFGQIIRKGMKHIG